MCAKLFPPPDDDLVLMGQPLLSQLMTAFQQRYEDILDVIDDALESENMKERIWAVEQILKRCKSPNTAKTKSTNPTQGQATVKKPLDLSHLTQEQLWAELDALFGRVSTAPTTSTELTRDEDVS